MLIKFSAWIDKESAQKLEENGWKLSYLKDDTYYAGKRSMLDENGTFCGSIAKEADKDFPSPKDAMFEVEKLLGCDVISDRDYDGCSLYAFHWNWEDEENRGFAMGWACACVMYDAPKTERETAIALYEMRNGE